MINGLEGIPGSGKSYEAVAYHVLPMLQAGRKVITNLPLLVDMFAAIDPSYRGLIELRRRPAKVLGTWDADRMDEDGNGQAFELFPDPAMAQPAPHHVSVFGHVWDYYSDWKHPTTGRGPVFIVDEAHVPLPKNETDRQVVEWFKLHRHFNADVLLMTQSFRDINQPIAGLLAMLVICRKADILGKEESYIRKVKGGYRGAVISTELRPYKPEFFPLYKSHTNGNSVAESAAGDVSPTIVRLRRFTWAFWAFTIPVCVWAFWPSGKPTPKPIQTRTTTIQTTQLPPPGEARAVPVSAGPPTTPAAPPAPTNVIESATEVPEPYATKGLHLTGRIAMGKRVVYTFSVSASNQRVTTIDSTELIAAGYKWEPLTDCAGTLRWKTKAMAITCDAPAIAAGTSDKPHVIAVPVGGGAPVGSSHDMPRTVPMPSTPAHDPTRITQADITPGLRLRNPTYSGPAS